MAFVLGGVAAWLGGSLPVQLLIGGVFAVAGTIAAHQWRKRHAMPAPQAGLDVGQEVDVVAWHDNGTARVQYRGTQWDAELAAPGAARAKTMYIVATRGSTLVIAPTEALTRQRHEGIGRPHHAERFRPSSRWRFSSSR